jgi:hypothetical protein
MDTWLRELRSPPGEGPFRGASRQVDAGFRLLRRDRTILALTLLGAAALAGMWIGFFYLQRESGPLGRDADRVFRFLVFGAASIGVTLLLSLSVACAADARIDGAAGGIRLALAEVRERLPALLGWWAISVVLWAGLALMPSVPISPLLAALLIAAIWGLTTIFVVPTMAIEGSGLGTALSGGLRLLRARWGRALIGILLLACFLFFASIPGTTLLEAGARRNSIDRDSGRWLYFGGLALFYLAFAVTLAAREGFALVLARNALGDLPGEPAQPKPRRRGWVIFRRVALGVFGLLIALGILGAILRHRRQAEPASAPAGATFVHGERFVAQVEALHAELLVPGAPVVLQGQPIGSVFMVDVESVRPWSTRLTAAFHADPRYAPTLAQSQVELAMRDGRAYLVVVPQPEPGTLSSRGRRAPFALLPRAPAPPAS